MTCWAICCQQSRGAERRETVPLTPYWPPLGPSVSAWITGALEVEPKEDRRATLRTLGSGVLWLVGTETRRTAWRGLPRLVRIWEAVMAALKTMVGETLYRAN